MYLYYEACYGSRNSSNKMVLPRLSIRATFVTTYSPKEDTYSPKEATYSPKEADPKEAGPPLGGGGVFWFSTPPKWGILFEISRFFNTLRGSFGKVFLPPPLGGRGCGF